MRVNLNLSKFEASLDRINHNVTEGLRFDPTSLSKFEMCVTHINYVTLRHIAHVTG